MTEKEIPPPDDDGTPAPQNVCYLRLCTGDEVIGDCLGETDDQKYVVIKYPMLVSEVSNPFTQATNVALSKYIPLGQFEVLPIDRKDIVFILPVVSEMRDFYNSSVIYTHEFVETHIRDELKRSTMAVNKAILIDMKEKVEADVLKFPGKNVIVPGNSSTIH